jgi:hypothetical protein
MKKQNKRDVEVITAKLLEREKAASKEIATLKAIRQIQTAASTEPRYSPKVILRYREMEERRAFTREIKKRAPVNLGNDEITLSCGHKLAAMASLINAWDGKFPCRKCKERWLAKAVREERNTG